MNDTTSVSEDYDITRSRTPSINSQAFAIPVSDDVASQLSDTTSNSSNNENENNCIEGQSIDNVSQPDSSDIVSTSEENEQSTEDNFLDDTVPVANTSTVMDNYDTPVSMIDVSKYIFESLVQSVESTDFSEALALQTKMSATINFKSLELRELIDTTQTKLKYLKKRFEEGGVTSKKLRDNLNYSNKKVTEINNILRTEYPIEFNQARDQILERHFDDNNDI